MKTYKIKPLEWNGSERSQHARVPFGSYHVDTYNGHTYTMSYCFQEYYDEGEIRVKSMKDGKKRAEKDWIKRISQALELA